MPRKMIYVPSEEVWEGIQKSAKEKGKSVSSYLLDGDNESEMVGILKRIESKLDSLVGKSNNKPDKYESHKPVKPDKLEELCDKAIKLKKEKSDWVNPLDGSKLAPKK